MKRIKIHSETVFFLGQIVLALAVSFGASADFGISMIVAPAYILNEYVAFLSFGQCEYIIEAIMIITLWICVKKFKIKYLLAFLTGIIYGAILDLWRLIPIFNISINPPESFSIPVRIVFFILSMVLASFGVALSFHTYVYPQVKDFFVKAMTKRYNFDLKKFKTLYDLSYVVVSVILSYVLLGTLKGIGIGTVIIALCNGTIIGFFDRTFTKYLDISPFSKKSEKIFES